ncbi:NUDIX domain-containing protein [Lederbergia wuyishanensis]|uniref:Isopentenyldiphosphate isomerase n=1 Tax=Lederbergia wuyishanensis TaxID=1347903 RepID=A0ABU0D265_9BACI|nr:NUDIX domain-containing protein [Lederbergia wuyishanensis]MCJ8007338.1 NUDIX domain-containing protein [Lederbergia wuyishanensis]MDQ0342496.1 isopentenyldiphosphate isomerase [Lederbergia wuyishanensis]
MEIEILNIFDENGKLVGKKSRKDVHEKGYWHETFQCWIVGREDGTNYIYFQIRSDEKADFPGLLDITAAGHILADETVEDGIREVQEELGIEVTMDELIPLGIIKNTIKTGHFIDNEFGNNYLYITEQNLEFNLQVEEVSGMVKAKFEDFYQFCFGELEEILVISETESDFRYISKNDFVPHQDTYFITVAERIAARI